MQPGNPPITSLTERELDVIEIFKIAFSSLRSSWKISILPVFVVSAGYAAFSYFQSVKILETISTNPAEQVEQIGQMMGQMLAGSMAVGIVFFSLLICLGIVPSLVAAARNVDPEAARKPVSGAIQYLLGCLIAALPMMIGTILCIFPGLFLAVALFMFPAVIFVEETSFGRAFGISYRTFAMRKGKVFALLLLYIIGAFAISILLAIPGQMYYYGGLAEMVRTENPSMLPELMKTYMLLAQVPQVLSIPLTLPFSAHLGVIAYANFRHFVPAGPEF
ncbi:MAG: hypothetical protein KDK23_11805 [Leptospiraceae bacterium]|nr:hypothetical protein [Leptospiraceae bacterium]